MPLLCASKHGHDTLLPVLAENGADVNARGKVLFDQVYVSNLWCE